MKIGVNLIQYTDVQGIEVFAKNLLIELVKQNREDKFVFFLNQESAKIFNFSADNISVVVKNFKKLSRNSLIIYQQCGFLRKLRREKIDILYCPSTAAPIFYRKKIVTIHDCAAQRFPEEAGFVSRLYLKLIFLSAKYYSLGVVTVSNFSKKEIIDLLHMPVKNIKVISEGAPELAVVSESEVDSVIEKFKLKDCKFFFYISNLRPRKNIPGLLMAWEIFSSIHPEYRLVIAGKNYNYYSDNPNILFLGPVSEIEKVSLYKRAIAFVFPSLYEGFGLPILEAQSLGLPVFSSNSSSLIEVAGDGAIFFNSHDPKEMAEKLKEVTKPCFARSELIEKGYVNVKKFSWFKAASELSIFINNIKKDL